MKNCVIFLVWVISGYGAELGVARNGGKEKDDEEKRRQREINGNIRKKNVT